MIKVSKDLRDQLVLLEKKVIWEEEELLVKTEKEDQQEIKEFLESLDRLVTLAQMDVLGRLDQRDLEEHLVEWARWDLRVHLENQEMKENREKSD